MNSDEAEKHLLAFVMLMCGVDVDKDCKYVIEKKIGPTLKKMNDFLDNLPPVKDFPKRTWERSKEEEEKFSEITMGICTHLVDNLIQSHSWPDTDDQQELSKHFDEEKAREMGRAIVVGVGEVSELNKKAKKRQGIS